jgi:hypothetical protein
VDSRCPYDVVAADAADELIGRCQLLCDRHLAFQSVIDASPGYREVDDSPSLSVAFGEGIGYLPDQ